MNFLIFKFSQYYGTKVLISRNLNLDAKFLKRHNLESQSQLLHLKKVKDIL
jgi:hypothetical protein